MASPPAATPSPRPSSGPGCLVALLLLPVVVVGGLIIGTVLKGDDDPDDLASFTLDEGRIDGTEWRVDAERDEQGDSCAFLYQDDEQLTGGCSLTPQDATIGDQTVVFGKASTDTTEVRVVLDNGEVVKIETTTAKGIEGRFYVTVLDGDVDAEALAP